LNDGLQVGFIVFTHVGFFLPVSIRGQKMDRLVADFDNFALRI
jgi:hypothetical protein